MTVSYPEAVRRAKTTIQSAMREEIASSVAEMMLRSAGGGMLRRNPDELLAWAANSTEGFDATRLAIADEVERGNSLPPQLSTWLVKFLRGEVVRPNGRAGRKSEFWLHSVIWIAVSARVAEGMKATRNDGSEPTSACDAVADALAELGLEPTSFYGVKRIWLEKEKTKGTTIQAT